MLSDAVIRDCKLSDCKTDFPEFLNVGKACTRMTSGIQDSIEQITESRDTIDDLLVAMYRLQDMDEDTRDVEIKLQTLIERELQQIDNATDDISTEMGQG
ncbi:hypothetical protein EA473_06150 [Natrarchaeobius chitinivorans]|uniref:Uncharacterized protein n=2 Tax=Natrarchaeobius chitinivorans TaxID=1679083 RepID=A0A3N6P9V1_NATCH|nr:hypothetical protein EA473_06150 [Natrarchaeobius chitinivorans]